MYTLESRFAFPIRLLVPKRIPATMNAYGADLTATEAMSVILTGVPEKLLKTTRTTTPAPTMTIGIRSAHANPMMDCL